MYGHKYTPEERAFLLEYIPGHTYKEIQAEFISCFGWEISICQIKGYMGNHKINNGLTGRFPKGHIPPNKGKKGQCASGCEKGWFKKGHIPKNHRSVGAERVNADGYVEIKVAEPNQWKLKHRVIWEEHKGEIPPNSVIIFVDSDKQNVTLDNLRLIEKSTNAVINHSGLSKFNGVFKDTAITIAELKKNTSVAKKNSAKK